MIHHQDTKSTKGAPDKALGEGEGRIDCLVEGVAILELKSVEQILPIHEAQLLTDLRLTGKRLGFILDFNAPRMKDGIRRRVL